jgi:hypothetical protein
MTLVSTASFARQSMDAGFVKRQVKALIAWE